LSTAASAAPAAHLDVEDVLRRRGLAPFHRRAVLVTGAAWTFVAMEILLVGFVAPIFHGLWSLNGTWQGLINSAALAGSLVGSLVLGRAADRIGRRGIFQGAILWYAVFTALTALAWGPWSILALRFLAGIGLGGMLVVDPALLTEYLPPQRRGRLLVLLDFFWPVGLLLATGLSYVFLDRIGGDDAWRYLFLAASFPAFLAFVVRRTLPESPFYLARRGRKREAADVLEQITGERPDEEALAAAATEERSSLKDVLAPGLRRTAAMMLAVWIALNISYYGLFLWLPFEVKVSEFGLNVYAVLAFSALSQFPGYLAALWLVERIGRKPTLVAFLFLGGVSAFSFAVADTSEAYVISLFFVGFFNLGAWGAVYPYTAELFPTRMRSTAFGLVEGVGKAAAISGPYIFGALRDWSGGSTWSLVFVALVMAAGGAVALALGRETRGQRLA
jgi:MFS transporter, putative metabolite:H+ symporter